MSRSFFPLFGTKRCSSCGVEKPIEENFWKGQCYCIPCHKEKQKKKFGSRTPKKRLEQHLKYKYKTTLETFFQIIEEQAGKCAICCEELPDLMVYEQRRRGYAVDHNHETGKVRGLLCISCNSVLGLSKDNPDVLRRAARYLEERGSYARFRKSKKK